MRKGHDMDKLIAELINIEETAKASLEGLKDEKTTYAAQTADEITRRNLDIRRKADQQIQAIKQQEEEYTQAQLAEIDSQLQQQSAELRALFETHMQSWRADWTNRVLQR